jgi:hypothetical protein
MEFKILKQNLLHKRYLHVYNRTVQFPDGKIVDWDIVGHERNSYPNFVVVFPFDCTTKTTTVLLEYCQGVNEALYTFASGAFEPNKHSSIDDCVRAELSEEMQLHGGEMLHLMPIESKGVSELKWCMNRFAPVLVLNPTTDPSPKPADFEECIIEVKQKVSIEELEEIILQGKMLLPSVQTAWMGIKKLKSMGYL